MTVRTRAIDLRTSWLFVMLVLPKSSIQFFLARIYAHLGELRCVPAGNLLCAQLNELALQIIELLSEVLLVLRPELGGLNFACRLREELVGALIWPDGRISPL